LNSPAVPLGSDEASRFPQRLSTRLEQQQPFSGGAVAQRGGKDVFTLVQGVADATAETAITRATGFGMASGSKMFTAIAVLQRAEEGRLSLIDPLIEHGSLQMRFHPGPRDLSVTQWACARAGGTA